MVMIKKGKNPLELRQGSIEDRVGRCLLVQEAKKKPNRSATPSKGVSEWDLECIHSLGVENALNCAYYMKRRWNESYWPRTVALKRSNRYCTDIRDILHFRRGWWSNPGTYRHISLMVCVPFGAYYLDYHPGRRPPKVRDEILFDQLLVVTCVLGFQLRCLLSCFNNRFLPMYLKENKNTMSLKMDVSE